MPLMKVRKEDDTGWYTVDHLNFNYIGLNLSEPIVLVPKKNENQISKIYVYDGKNNQPPYDGEVYEEIVYKSNMNKALEAKMPKLLEAKTSSTEANQKNINITNIPGQEGALLIEHRTLTDKGNEEFHILNYWNGVRWVPLNNIWG